MFIILFKSGFLIASAILSFQGVATDWLMFMGYVVLTLDTLYNSSIILSAVTSGNTWLDLWLCFYAALKADMSNYRLFDRLCSQQEVLIAILKKFRNFAPPTCLHTSAWNIHSSIKSNVNNSRHSEISVSKFPGHCWTFLFHSICKPAPHKCKSFLTIDLKTDVSEKSG